MTKSSLMRGLSDTQLLAVVESMPEGMALTDAAGQVEWANRRARQLFSLRATTSPEDDVGTELGVLVRRLVGVMPVFRNELSARWTVTDGGIVEIELRRTWASQVAVRLSPSADVVHAARGSDAAARPSTWQLLVVERLLDEAAVGLVVADAAGHIGWMNPQAQRLLGGGNRHIGPDLQRTVARAARHVASGQLRAPIRMHVDLRTRVVDALFWDVAPGLAGVLFDGGTDDVRTPFSAHG